MDFELTGYFRMVGAMTVVISLMYGLYFLLRKRVSPLHNRDNKKIKVIEMTALAPKKSLCLVEVEGQKFLLSLCADSITSLGEITPKNSFATVLGSAEQKD